MWSSRRPGQGHDDIHTLAQGPGLGKHAHAAVDDAHAQPGTPAEIQGRLVDLFGQFPGGGQDQGPRAAHLGRVGHQSMQNGQQKGGRLAGAGLGQAHEIAAGGHVGDGLGLYGGSGFRNQAV